MKIWVTEFWRDTPFVIQMDMEFHKMLGIYHLHVKATEWLVPE
ncbi:hypothetical protein N425_05535 [Tannerella sp. oral taxon BU063 isolate Cell 2]|uniref:Uncharacterized protein n=1 Tax=Tannerella sp. oral taxon BU063 isolate Cell 2 TaxID=1411148 RepID=W2C580_9BACT|nr:hypothetical protein N425_05535 [Tannerella sp. oral taxon BU063 isolate Cell 2]